MEPRKIETDKKMSSEEIKQTMDFDNLVRNYTSQTKRKNVNQKFYLAGSIVSVLIGIILFNVYQNTKKENSLSINTVSDNQPETFNSLQPASSPLSEPTNNSTSPSPQQLPATALSKPLNSESKTPNREYYQNFKEYYSQNPVKSQWFRIDAERDTTLTGEQGTKLFIKAYSFVDLKDNAANGFINIELKECYKWQDMLKENLSTQTDQSVLESGGMIFIGAESISGKLKLKEFTEIEMTNPIESVNADTSMHLYYGNRDNNSYEIDWSLDKYSRIPYPVVTLVEAKLHSAELIKSFANSFRYKKETMLEHMIQGTKLDFDISLNENKKVIGYKTNVIEEGKGTPLTEFLNLANQGITGVPASTWKSYFSFKIFETKTYELYCTKYAEYKKNEELTKERRLLFPANQSTVLSSYFKPAFFIGKLGWINFDREFGPTKEVNYVQIKITSSDNEKVKLVLMRDFRKTILKPIKAEINGLWIFQNVPVGYDAILSGEYIDKGHIRKVYKNIQVSTKATVYELNYGQPDS